MPSASLLLGRRTKPVPFTASLLTSPDSSAHDKQPGGSRRRCRVSSCHPAAVAEVGNRVRAGPAAAPAFGGDQALPPHDGDGYSRWPLDARSAYRADEMTLGALYP